MSPRHLPAALLLLGAAPLCAQPLPDRVAVGDGHMTVGFELKTTTHGDGPDGRTRAHSLMDLVVPTENAGWGEAERATVERWSELSRAERTAFFFAHYRGGHQASNFRVDSTRFPFLDGTISWYGSMNIPHIEVRSKPFDSPREALEAMKRLKAEIPETIAFHVHTRFPQANGDVAANAEALTEWFRRVSWAIWLRRADYSSKTDFVLKAMDNQPINVTELNNALEELRRENPGARKDIIERRGIRLHRLRNADGSTSLDIEFRGLMRDTGRIERYLRLTGEAFGEGRTGGGAFDAANPFRDHDSRGVFKFRTFGWHGKGSWEPRELDYLADKLEELRARFGVSSRVAEADLRTAYRRLATADTENGKKMLLPSAFSWLFLPIEYDPALPEGVQEQVEERKAEYVRKLVRLAERVHRGEFTRPGQIASRARRILYDFVNETYTDAGKHGKLFEWYELSLFRPEELAERTERYRRETGRNRAEAWRRANPPRPTGEGEGFGPRRRGAAEALASYWDLAEVERIFSSARTAALERAAERALAQPELADELERVRRASLELDPSRDVDARYEPSRDLIRVSAGLLDAIDARARELPPAERTTFRRRALGLIFGHELAHAYGIRAERVADAEGLRLLARSPLGAASEAEARAVLEAFARGERLGPLERVRAWLRYGTDRGRAEAIARTARGEADPYAPYRRTDGTIDWKRLGGARAGAEAAGLLHFGLALFLKELALVAATGDRLRIEEFFEGLLTTDFYKEYGLFVVGARAGEVAYTRYLQRFVKPRFLSGILKTNLVLATGIALPQIVGGTFSGKAFAISLGSLGLSATAVRAGLRSIEWVVDLRRARRAGGSLRLAAGAGRLARLGGWFYSVAELAVVLTLADAIEERVHAHLEREDALDRLAAAGEALRSALADPAATPAAARAAADAYHQAWSDYRDFLYAPLHRDEALFAHRLEKLARKAKLLADRRAALLARVEGTPSLRRWIASRHESPEAYADALLRREEDELARDLETAAELYDRERTEHLRAVYEDHRRDAAIPLPPEAFGAAGFSAIRARSLLRRAHRAASSNRLEAYDDEAAVLAAAASALARDGREELAREVREIRALALRTRAADAALARGEAPRVGARGAAGALEAAEPDGR